jgi:excisionase family DNA binding protein
LPPPSGPMITVREMAARLGVSRATIYTFCERGELPHLRVSGAIRIPTNWADAFVKSRVPASFTRGGGKA